jgi:hypothetical protein
MHKNGENINLILDIFGAENPCSIKCYIILIKQVAPVAHQFHLVTMNIITVLQELLYPILLKNYFIYIYIYIYIYICNGIKFLLQPLQIKATFNL